MTMRRLCLFVLATLACANVHAQCPAPSLPASQWKQLQARDFSLPDGENIQRAALALLACLDDPNPELRDGIAFEALSAWMRGQRVSTATGRQLLQHLSARLRAPDERGFGRPFAALVLAEVARMDRMRPFLAPSDFSALVADAADYVTNIRDYRGFDEREGWRHGVAHGADLFMQLALNPRTSKSELDAMLAAVAMQVAPANHSYVYGESARLARAVVFIAQRHLHSKEEWTAWLRRLATPAPFHDWSTAQQSQAGLAKHHDTTAFFNALFVATVPNFDEELADPLLAPLRQVMGEL